MNKPCECCNQIIPTFKTLTKEKEEIVRQIYRDTGQISAINKLRELTKCGLKEAKIWVDHCEECVHRKTIHCPFCNELLRTE